MDAGTIQKVKDGKHKHCECFVRHSNYYGGRKMSKAIENTASVENTAIENTASVENRFSLELESNENNIQINGDSFKLFTNALNQVAFPLKFKHALKAFCRGENITEVSKFHGVLRAALEVAGYEIKNDRKGGTLYVISGPETK